MRIISGQFRGRKLKAPTGDNVRPTTDRVKESMFNIIATKVPGSKVLDLFGGSGALGIEAASRGAQIAYIVDNDQNSFKNIRLNARDIVSIVPILSDYNLALKNFAHKNMLFDIIFLDPPYDSNFALLAIKQIYELNLLAEDGIIIWEEKKKLKKSANFKCPFEIYDVRNYGETSLNFLKKSLQN